MIGLDLFEEDEDLNIVMSYDSGRFDLATIRRMLEHYLRLVDAVSMAPDMLISTLDMLSDSEREKLLNVWSHGEPVPALQGWVHERIDRQALQTPEAIALVGHELSITYRDLYIRSDRLAGYLRTCGVRQGTPVVVWVERGVTSIVALLAVLKSGATWIPLDSDCPPQRLNMILDDIGACAMIVDEEHESQLALIGNHDTTVIRLDHDFRAISQQPHPMLKIEVAPDQHAYLIYTSGTTGRPKGVPITHYSIAVHCQAVIERYGLGATDVVLQFAAHHVDTSLEQILPALMCGAKLVLREAEPWSPPDFCDLLTKHHISVADLPPAYLRELLQAWTDDPQNAPTVCPRLLIVGGEVLSPATVRLWQSGPFANARLLNAYGPTEATITCIVHEVEREASGMTIPIGRPLPGGEVYLLDQDRHPVPEGVVGELYIGGIRLAPGYHDRPELSCERFVSAPFDMTRSGSIQGRVLYRTGDYARFIPGSNGLIAFHGRIDEQVKIRGFRIELGEIEATLRAFGALEAVVVAGEDSYGDQMLVACVVPGTTGLDHAALAKHMADHLPAVMWPTAYVLRDVLPLTSGGKLDRAAVLAAASNSQPLAPCCQPPRDAVERRLAHVWQKVLGCEINDIHADFFVSGGHSLMALRLLSAIEIEFGQKLRMNALLRAPTLAQQAQLLSKGASDATASPLVLLAGQSSQGLPLFLIHPVGGDVLCYVPLARALGAERPVYGLQSIILSEGLHAPDLKGMAQSYIALMREIQPEGPYQLAGWSLGGVIAYEMAQQLRASGLEVRLLALIDSYATSLLAEMELHHASVLNAQVTEESAQELMLEPLRSELEVANSHAVRGYEPQPYYGPLILFYASDYRPDDLTLGWGELALGGLTTYALAGNHYSLMQPEQLGSLIAQLSDCLQTDILPVGAYQ